MLVGIGVMIKGILTMRHGEDPNSKQSAHPMNGIELRGAGYNNGLKIWLQNNSSKTIGNCEIFLAGVQRYSEKQRDFEQAGSFSGILLMEPRTLGPNQRTKPESLFSLPKPNGTFLIAFDVHGTRKPVSSVDKNGI